TNGEIVIGNADWMVACACSAGPAFEGSGIKCGMRASRGAIEEVEIGPDLSIARYKVVGASKPAGICGSGLISLLGELFVRGLVDQAGRFNMESGSPHLAETEQGRVFVIERGESTLSGEDLVITEADIENLVRTKGAIYAACSLILDNVGLNWDAISRVYIAGGFGRYINVSDAVLIGMLPDLEPVRFRYVGNSALTGAYIALLSRERRARLGEIAAKMTYVDLSSDPRYMDNYVKALFLPHTDMHLFPTVARKMESVRAATRQRL
ncbi:MAG: ATP-binding protein, partial [Bryobacteraceae bacterium]